MPGEKEDDAARRAFWIRQMDAAHRLIDVIMTYPVVESGERLVYLPNAAEAAGVTVLFSSSLLAGKHERLFYLREGLLSDFLAITQEANRRGWLLKIEDGYRTRSMQKDLGQDRAVFDAIFNRVVWERSGHVPTPEQMFRRLSALVATRPKIGTHMSGSALDVSVLRLDNHEEVDRGASYLELSEITPMGSPFVTTQARRNRSEIRGLFARHGFVAYPFEFWHYSKGDAFEAHLSGSRRPARYGAVDLDPESGSTTPIENPTDPLFSLDEVRARIDQALHQRNLG